MTLQIFCLVTASKGNYRDLQEPSAVYLN